jgi:hypothetical protein
MLWWLWLWLWEGGVCAWGGGSRAFEHSDTATQDTQRAKQDSREKPFDHSLVRTEIPVERSIERELEEWKVKVQLRCEKVCHSLHGVSHELVSKVPRSIRPVAGAPRIIWTRHCVQCDVRAMGVWQ